MLLRINRECEESLLDHNAREPLDKRQLPAQVRARRIESHGYLLGAHATSRIALIGFTNSWQFHLRTVDWSGHLSFYA